MDCNCEFTVDPEDLEDDWHYDRTCLFCGYRWRGLHCPHDGYQNPCPNCGKIPIPERGTAVNRYTLEEWARGVVSSVKKDGEWLTLGKAVDELNRLSELEQACKAMVKHDTAILRADANHAELQGFAAAWQRMLDALKGGTA